MARLLSRSWDLSAFRSAARAGIALPGVFAFAHEVIGRPQTSLLAAFGSFAVLVLVDFGGVPQTRLLAYIILGVAGAGLIALGTVCSRDPWAAAGAMAIVGFTILFAGGLSGYIAAAANGAILLFVLSANVSAADSAIPDRLLGWALAAGVGTATSLVLWPSQHGADLRRAVAAAMRAVVVSLETDASEARQRSAAAEKSVAGLERAFLGSQHRPAGPTVAAAALIAIPDEIDWLLSFLVTPDDQSPLDASGDEETEALAAIAAVLGASADRLEGGDAQADFERLTQARDDLVAAMARRVAEHVVDSDIVPVRLETSFRVRSATFAAQLLTEYAMRATAGDPPAEDLAVHLRALVHGPLEVARQHASLRSVWLRNSVRAAVALAIAVYVAQRIGVQNAFWAVLGTLSVLRSNALGTGWSIVSAITGTAVGIAVGAPIVIGIGIHDAALWVALPIAVTLAAYAPRVISFAAGQAAFTVMLLVLFNLIQPLGWRIGIVRAEDVAIGCAVSLGVGLLFWPRGAGGKLRADLANAYACAADHLVSTTSDFLRGPDLPRTRRTQAAADAAIHELDDSFRQYLVERTATRSRVEDLAALVNGANRVHRTAQAVAVIAEMTDPAVRTSRCISHITGQLNALRAWYASLSDSLLSHDPVPAPRLRDCHGLIGLYGCRRSVAHGGDSLPQPVAVSVLAIAQLLENLRRMEAHIAGHPAARRVGGTLTTLIAPERTTSTKRDVIAPTSRRPPPQ